MMAKLVYGIIGCGIFILGFISNFFPGKMKHMLAFFYEKELFFIPGIIEVVTSLVILYFRYNTSFPMINTIIGVLIFVDGIFYITGNKILRDTFEQILEMEENIIRYYSIIFYILAAFIVFSVL